MHPLHSRVVDDAGRPTQALLQLLSRLDVEHDGTLADVVKATQQRFFQRKEAGQAKERWELEEIVPTTPSDAMRHLGETLTPMLRSVCLDSLGDLGLLEEVHPSWADYGYILVLGALVARVRGRLAHLIRLWSTGCPATNISHVRSEAIVFLGGERPLLPDQESMAVLLDANNGILPFRDGWTFSGQEPKTELEMMRLIWDQADIPDEMRRLPLTWVNAKMKPGAQGPATRRPSTEDTVQTWLKEHEPKSGRCLAVSNQPHVGYQDAVLQTHLSPSFAIETIGAAASLDHKLAFYLGELAGWLRQLEILQSTSS